MKPVSLLILLSFISVTCLAQKPIVINVEKLEAPKDRLQVHTYQAILERLILSDHGAPHYPLNKQHTGTLFNIVAKSKHPDSLVTFGYHPFFQGMLSAYANHRPFTLSPDMMWLLISQGFATHVNNNSEALRSMFVDFKGKTTLTVTDNRIELDNPDSPWEEVFPEFSKQISENTGAELTNVLTADFSTTTPITKMASQITMLEAMKSYFEFLVINIGCGIPKITLEGTPADWHKVLTKTRALRKYKLDWWVDKMEPILINIEKASEGKKDKEFWQTMFKWHSQKVYGAPFIVDGWIVKFFPYDKMGHRNNLETLATNPDLPNEIVKVDLEYKKGDGLGDFVTTPLELWAGFVGLKQNDADFNLRPEIGWMIRKKEASNDDELKARLQKDAKEWWGITLRVKALPKAIFAIGPIKSLTVVFTDDVIIPDEIAAVPIQKFRITGKITPDGIDRIKKLLPKTELIINNNLVGQQPNN
ncbi:DUF4419 domain-containing protein [Mucilaginibacter sp. UR6-11]|uniref:DUF4419 domain-containing protein n=1 Tax=Mucilaginibacter sp. UR6-11 TaxID=1435644 RepID=UPI001E2E37BB|nr:DUF4419 domain-containing protein [Mucilaginibacter sp. UR6-11]MCC8424193.1 DUF4419 domain-containing protein [Mucilaginibacter sp. UR6-11]